MKTKPTRQRKVRIGPARHGRGVFAQKRFEQDDVIGRIRGEMVDDPGHEAKYVMEMDNDQFTVPKAPFRYVNHSCDPSAEIFMWDDDPVDPLTDSRPLFVAARRTILPGEELSIDYAWPAHFAIRCGCSAEQCRGWIVAPEEAHEMKNPK